MFIVVFSFGEMIDHIFYLVLYRFFYVRLKVLIDFLSLSGFVDIFYEYSFHDREYNVVWYNKSWIKIGNLALS